MRKVTIFCVCLFAALAIDFLREGLFTRVYAQLQKKDSLISGEVQTPAPKSNYPAPDPSIKPKSPYPVSGKPDPAPRPYPAPTLSPRPGDGQKIGDRQ